MKTKTHSNNKDAEAKPSQPHFDMDIILESGTVKRAVCFDESRYPLFAELNDNETYGVQIKRPRHDQNDGLIITDFSKTIKVEANHIEVKQPTPTLIADALGQKSLFERFHVKGVLTNLSKKQEHKNTEGEILIFKTAIFNDISGQFDMTLYGQIIENIEENQVYAINHVYFGKFLTKRILKTSDVSKINKLNEKMDIILKKVDSPFKVIQCKFVTIDMKTIINKFLCHKCNREVTPDKDKVFVCQHCDIMGDASLCKVDNKVSCVIKDQHRQYVMKVTQDLLVNAVDDASVEDLNKFSKKLILKKFEAEINLKENIITKLKVQNDEKDMPKHA